jgi:hypothetical protein
MKYCLVAPAPMAIRLMFLVFNISKNNPVLANMFVIPQDYDPFANDFFETDKPLFENGVHQSRFWEIILLKKHMLSEVRTVAFNLVSRSNEPLDFVDLEKYSKLNLEKLLVNKLKKVKC